MNTRRIILSALCVVTLTATACSGVQTESAASSMTETTTTISHNDWVKDASEHTYDMPKHTAGTKEDAKENNEEQEDLHEKVAGIISDLEENDELTPVTETPKPKKGTEIISWDETLEYAGFSRIHSDSATLYHAEDGKGITVAVNAGHGCSGGEQEKTQCHPDGTPKVTGGSTAAGSTMATAINGGTTLADGTKEADAVLDIALNLKDILLNEGYDVLMLRENDDTQLDNIARTVLANNHADCHISIHYDSTDSDKGVFYIGVPQNGAYREMEPVKSHWQEHEKLGESIVNGIENKGMDLYDGGRLELDLTQTSYSTIPSIDLEVGDKASDRSEETRQRLVEGIARGLNTFFDN